ncbi:MAG: MBL fold metallo-hydrolase [Clostridia bacterium]|nr:MBL fold metallo-hydrolase [Clostridia bacterium]MBN2882413.1 MBL fold metallo-hydrolase [Clostridia bacterium]
MLKISKHVYWDGIRDWDLRLFHGHELSTHRGSTYNSFIIKDEKTVLVDTVWFPHTNSYIDRIEHDVGIDNIDFIIINHNEPDHGGALKAIMEKRPELPIYCSANGEKIIKAHFHKDWNFNVVKTGDTINIGRNNLKFIEMKMIHWPDSMMVYLDNDKVLLSNDAFGQHYCAMSMFNDEVDRDELFQEAIKYYANILTPFSPLIARKIDEVLKLNLDIEIIAPSHGVIWRENPLQIIEAYASWSDNYKEDFAVIVYDTMYEATLRMAEAIEKGLRSKGVKVKLYNSSVSDMSDLLTEIFKAKALAIGSCTVNNNALTSIVALTHEIAAHKMKGKPFVSFGSYGWSGEAPAHISETLVKAGLTPVHEPIKTSYTPTEEALEECVRAGVALAEAAGE